MHSRYDTPYFFLFETISNWTQNYFEKSWLEYITHTYGPGLKFGQNEVFWSHSEQWNEPFRDLLRQTWEDTEFLLMQYGNKRISDNDVP